MDEVMQSVIKEVNWSDAFSLLEYDIKPDRVNITTDDTTGKIFIYMAQNGIINTGRIPYAKDTKDPYDSCKKIHVNNTPLPVRYNMIFFVPRRPYDFQDWVFRIGKDNIYMEPNGPDFHKHWTIDDLKNLSVMNHRFTNIDSLINNCTDFSKLDRWSPKPMQIIRQTPLLKTYFNISRSIKLTKLRRYLECTKFPSNKVLMCCLIVLNPKAKNQAEINKIFSKITGTSVGTAALRWPELKNAGLISNGKVTKSGWEYLHSMERSVIGHNRLHGTVEPYIFELYNKAMPILKRSMKHG